MAGRITKALAPAAVTTLALGKALDKARSCRSPRRRRAAIRAVEDWVRRALLRQVGASLDCVVLDAQPHRRAVRPHPEAR